MRQPLLALAAAAAVVTLVHAQPGPALDNVRLIPVEGEAAKYWPRWRGPSGQGHVTGTNYTDTWSAKDHIKWRVQVPGIGHSSPIVWRDHIFLTTATEDGATVSMMAFRRSDGTRLWQTVVPSTGVEHVYWKNSRASATPSTDGQLVYASFGTHGLAAFDFSGKIVWHRKLGELKNYHGSAGSPLLYKSRGGAAPDRIFLYQDHSGSANLKSFVAAFNAKTGETIWWKDRIETVGWGSPILIQAGDRDELVVSSQRRIVSYSPDTGEELWTVRGNMMEVIPTPVVGHGFVFCSSGRAGPTFAIRPGGKGDVTGTHVAWSSPKGSPFVISGLVHGELLYLVNDMQSILTVFDAKTGTLAYQDRLGEPVREGFSSSPVAVGNKVFITNESGQTFVVEAGPVFKLLRVNEMGARVLASPALVDGIWYWRTDRELIAVQ
jgi:outer membrane protein assembly factor BamB